MKKVLFFFLAIFASAGAFAQAKVNAHQLSLNKTQVVQAENDEEFDEIFAETLQEAKEVYEEGNVWIKGDNLYTDPGQFSSDWTELSEGSVEGGCDGDPATFWHSCWKNGSVPPGTHDFYITLPEAVSGGMQLAMTRRKQAMNDHILLFDVYAATSAEADFVSVGSVKTPWGGSNAETVTGNFTVPEGTTQLRFVIAQTDIQRGYGHFAEFQVYTCELDPECYNALNPKAAAAFAEILEWAEGVTNPTAEDCYKLFDAATAYAEGDKPEVVVAAIRLADSDNLYFSTNEVPDHAVTTYSLTDEPEYFTFTPTEDGGYILQSTTTDKYVGHSVTNTWDFSDDASTWYIENMEGEPTYILRPDNKGFGVDYAYAGAGVYTDKGGFEWIIEVQKGEEPVDPVDPVDPVVDPMPKAGKAYYIRSEAFGTTDDVYYVGAGETPETEPVAWLCDVDEDGMYTFTNVDGEVLHFRGWENGGTTWEITPMSELTAADMNQGSLPATYVKPEVVVMRGYHSAGRFIYLNINLAGGKFDHGNNLFAPWNSNYSSFFVFEETEVFTPVTEWNGEINVKEEAATIDDLLDYPVEFEEANEVSATDLGVLGAIYNENGDIYAVALAGKNYNQFGSLEVEKSVAHVHFAKVSDIKAELAEAVVKKIGGFIEPATGVATVYICPKSFSVDGAVYAEAIKQEYTLAGNGTTTGIESINAESNKVELFDLQGRRVNVPVKGNLYIQNGKKVVK